VKYEIRALKNNVVNEDVQAMLWHLSEKRCTKRHDIKPCCGRTKYKAVISQEAISNPLDTN
jgi:hypothetical protein